MKLPFQILLSIAAVYGAAASNLWLDQVAPVITPAEKKLYLSLQPEARQTFEENFWSTKSITAGEYFTRLEHIDSTYGSKKPGSGANTDPGRSLSFAWPALQSLPAFPRRGSSFQLTSGITTLCRAF